VAEEENVRRAVATRRRGFTHDMKVRGFELVADEPEDNGGADEGPRPTEYLAAALASCTAITIEMYADRKGWELGDLEVVAEYTPRAGKETPEHIDVILKLPGGLTEDQTQRIHRIAGKCPVHRALAGETDVSIEDRIEVSA
jgi:putative redox protein